MKKKSKINSLYKISNVKKIETSSLANISKANISKNEINIFSKDPNLPIKIQNIPLPDLPTLAAGFVHEVKNPLAAIHLHLQLLQNYIEEINEENLKIKLKTKVTLIQDEIKNLNHTLIGFFNLLKNESKININQKISLDSVIFQVIRLLEPQCIKENIKIFFEPSNKNCPRNLNPVYIRQIVLNLVLNSIQAIHTHQNNYSKMKEAFIKIALTIEKNNLILSVKDNGPGISKVIQKKIFEPFYTTKTKKNGGLGLTLVLKMVEFMGGKLNLQSKKKLGTIIKILFPIELNEVLQETIN